MGSQSQGAEVLLSRRLVLGCCLYAAVACSPHVAEAQTSSQRWFVSTERLLSIGEGGSSTQFARVAGLHRLKDGRIVALDGASQEIRVFSSDGVLDSKWSRRGAGPGELQLGQWIGASADTILVADLASRRVSLFAPPKGYLRSFLPIADDGSPLLCIARFRNGNYVVLVAGAQPLDLAAGQSTRDSVRIGIWNPSGSSVRWLGTFANATWVAFNSPDDPRRPWVVRADHAYGLGFAASENSLWISDTKSSLIRIFSQSGDSIGAARLPGVISPYDKRKLDRARAATLRDGANAHERAAAAARLNPSLLPVNAPTHTRLIPSQDGMVWVELYREDTRERAEFNVFDANGRLISTVTGPPRFDVRDVDSSTVSGVDTDQDGVQSISVRLIRRRGAGG